MTISVGTKTVTDQLKIGFFFWTIPLDLKMNPIKLHYKIGPKYDKEKLTLSQALNFYFPQQRSPFSIVYTNLASPRGETTSWE